MVSNRDYKKTFFLLDATLSHLRSHLSRNYKSPSTSSFTPSPPHTRFRIFRLNNYVILGSPTLSSHAETDFFYHTPFQLCWNRLYLLLPFPAMLKLALLTTPFYNHAETDLINYAPCSHTETYFQPCPNKYCFSTLYVQFCLFTTNPVTTGLRTIQF
jgi:hypothetical protein